MIGVSQSIFLSLPTSRRCPRLHNAITNLVVSEKWGNHWPNKIAITILTEQSLTKVWRSITGPKKQWLFQIVEKKEHIFQCSASKKASCTSPKRKPLMGREVIKSLQARSRQRENIQTWILAKTCHRNGQNLFKIFLYKWTRIKMRFEDGIWNIM